MKDSIIPRIPDAFIAQNLNQNTRSNSTSGGMFVAIAEYVIKQKGIVYGASFDDKFRVKHIGIEREDDLIKLQGSKYVQSFLGDCFYEIKTHLDSGREVCFSGTPCQVEGLYGFLGKYYDNLLTVGIVCYGVPSPKLFKKYISYIQDLYSDKLKAFYFRSKKYGYFSPTVVAEFVKKGKVDSKSAIKTFTKTYFSGVSIRPSCYECKVKTEKKKFDFLLGDCWRVSNYDKEFDDNRGTTSVFVYTKRGMKVLDDISKNIRISRVDEKTLINNDCSMIVKCKHRNPKRDLLFDNIDKVPYDELIDLVVPDSVINKIANIVKPIMYRMGIKDSHVLRLVKSYRIKKNSKN